ncbi:MAG: alpha/beta hydrolase [Candidatus Sumerlaeaceae bacterium]
MFSLLLSVIKITAIALLVLGLFLFFFQAKLIYHPRPYHPDYKRLIPERGVEIDYTTACGKQTAFYVPPRNTDDVTSAPARLWLFFGGNGSLALFWSDIVKEAPDPAAAFLLIDYPGYGKCEGAASPGSIEESSEAALAALASWLHCTPQDLEGDLNIAGHSLGAAVALQFAVRHPIRRAVLAAPFTSMQSMAREVVGPVLANVLTHNYNNEKRLAALAARPSPPEVRILHGDADPIIPVRMSRELATAHKSMIKLHEIPGADHVTVLDTLGQHLAP